jgi:hypothetical protein
MKSTPVVLKIPKIVLAEVGVSFFEIIERHCSAVAPYAVFYVPHLSLSGAS